MAAAIGVGMIGCGTVGGGVAKLLREHAELYSRRLGAPVALRRVLVRNVAKAQAAGFVDANLLTDSPDAFFDTPDMGIVIEAAGGVEPIGTHVRRAITTGRHVVTANKSLLAAQGPELFALARKHGVAVAFEASCAGGIPVITALKFGLMANRIDAIYGILNGTCNYILSEMTRGGKTYAAALAEAQQLGFAEADPTLDVSGRDAAQKLAILASLAFGIQAHGEDVWSEGIDKLDLSDIRFGAELGYDIKLLAIAERAGDEHTASLRVTPCFVNKDAPLAQVHGSFNAVSIYGHAVGSTMYMGRGAGQMPTASAMVSDLLNVASGWYPRAFAAMNIWCDLHPRAQPAPADELRSRFYIRVNALDVPGVMAKITAILGEMNISISAVLQHEAKVNEFVPVVITTHVARQGDLFKALERIGRLSVIDGPPVRIRIVDPPQG